jgi:hypothetical protein
VRREELMADRYEGEIWAGPGDGEDEELTAEEADPPTGLPFVVQWEDGSFSVKSEKWVSETYDMADCDYGEGVKQIYAANERDELVKISLGQREKINTDQEFPFRFERSPVYADTRIAGYVTWTDH